MNLGKSIARKVWWVAASSELLYCDQCGKMLTQGVWWKGDKALCFTCAMQEADAE